MVSKKYIFSLPKLSKQEKALRYLLYELRNYKPKISELKDILRKIDLEISQIKISMTEVLMNQSNLLIANKKEKQFRKLNFIEKKELVSKVIAKYYKNEFKPIYLISEEPQLDPFLLDVIRRNKKYANKEKSKEELEYIKQIIKELEKEDFWAELLIENLHDLYLKSKQKMNDKDKNQENRHRILIRFIHMLNGKHIGESLKINKRGLNYNDFIKNCEFYLDKDAKYIQKLILELIDLQILKFSKATKQFIMLNI